MNGKLKLVLEKVENMVGKGENAGYQHFLLFPQCFQKPYLSGHKKTGIVRQRINTIHKPVAAVVLNTDLT